MRFPSSLISTVFSWIVMIFLLVELPMRIFLACDQGFLCCSPPRIRRAACAFTIDWPNDGLAGLLFTKPTNTTSFVWAQKLPEPLLVGIYVERRAQQFVLSSILAVPPVCGTASVGRRPVFFHHRRMQPFHAWQQACRGGLPPSGSSVILPGLMPILR